MPRNILVLDAHSDDAPLACGGAMVRFRRDGDNLRWLSFTLGVDQGNCETRQRNVLTANRVFGAEVVIRDYMRRRLSEQRQEILDELLSERETFKPDIVLCPSRHDIHQDHHVIAEEAMRAFKHITLFGYEEPWNNFEFSNQCFIKLTEADVADKVTACAAFTLEQHRSYMNADYLRSLAKVHGQQAGCSYAEVFEVYRWIQ